MTTIGNFCTFVWALDHPSKLPCRVRLHFPLIHSIPYWDTVQQSKHNITHYFHYLLRRQTSVYRHPLSRCTWGEVIVQTWAALARHHFTVTQPSNPSSEIITCSCFDRTTYTVVINKWDISLHDDRVDSTERQDHQSGAEVRWGRWGGDNEVTSFRWLGPVPPIQIPMHQEDLKPPLDIRNLASNLCWLFWREHAGLKVCRFVQPPVFLPLF